MKCTKCNHILPDDSEFCQYCGSRIEKTARIPQEVPAAVKPKVVPAAVMPEAAAAQEATVSRVAVAPACVEPPKHSAEKAIPPMPDFNNRVPDVPEKAPKEKRGKQPKRKYCSRCGSLIDPQTKQCTGCGKKYFRGIKINKFAVAITIVSLILAASIGLNVLQYLDSSRINEEMKINRLRVENVEVENEILKQQKEDLEGKVSELKTQHHELRLTMSTYEDTIERMQADIDDYEPIVDFCKDHVEIIPNDGTNYYHKFSCNHLDMSNGFLVMNTEAAVGRGFTECPYCRYSQH